MKRSLIAAVVLAGAIALAVVAGTAQAGSSTRGTAARAATAQNGTMVVKFTVNRFVRVGKRLVAHGYAVARYTAPDGTITTNRQPYTARVRVGRGLTSSTTICPVLALDLEQLHLNLLGLIADLGKVTLTINANSDAGVLGKLFCSLVNSKASVSSLKKSALRMTKAAKRYGLKNGVASVSTPIAPPVVPTGAAGSTSPRSTAGLAQTCQVADLVLGPLHLELLGLIVDLSQVHLTITGDPAGGALGALFCQRAGGTTG